MAQSRPCSVFFPPEVFSHRYGEGFFTASVEDHRIVRGGDGSRHAVFTLRLKSGGRTWTVERRFSEFVELYEGLVAMQPQIEGLPTAPAKTCLPSFDTEFLSHRQAALHEFMAALLRVPGVPEQARVREFLTLPN